MSYLHSIEQGEYDNAEMQMKLKKDLTSKLERGELTREDYLGINEILLNRKFDLDMQQSKVRREEKRNRVIETIGESLKKAFVYGLGLALLFAFVTGRGPVQAVFEVPINTAIWTVVIAVVRRTWLHWIK